MAGWESRPSKRKQLTAGLGLTHGKELFTLSSSNLRAYNLCHLCSFVVFLTFTWRLSETQVLSNQSDPNRSLSQMAAIEAYILRSDFYSVHMLPCTWFCCIGCRMFQRRGCRIPFFFKCCCRWTRGVWSDDYNEHEVIEVMIIMKMRCLKWWWCIFDKSPVFTSESGSRGWRRWPALL